jgi:hypothetical protein
LEDRPFSLIGGTLDQPALPEVPMRRLSLTVCVLLSASAVATAVDFDERFTGATLRIDFFHTGTAGEEHFALDRIRVEGSWPGSRTQLVDTTNLGHYLVELVDLGTNTVLYSRGFASIYGEWETTGEALAGVWRTLPEAVRVPEAREPFQLRLRKRQPDQSFAEVWRQTIDPASRFVDRAPVTKRTVHVILESGDPALKLDLVVLGDGYPADAMDKFHADAERLVAALFAEEPFASRKSDFNVRAVDSASPQSGVSRPRAGTFRDSALGARYNTFDSERYVLSLDDRKWRDVAAAVPYDAVLILVNERKYGGGGIFNLYSTAAADSAFADYLVVHEFAHHLGALADEYFTSSIAYEELADRRVEPWEPNVTALLDPAKLKWADLLERGTPLPTPWDQERFEERSRESQARRAKLRKEGASEETLEQLFREEQQVMTEMLGSQEHSGRIGAFQGAMYQSRGLYRPALDCIMFTRDEVGYCPVCRRGLERVIDLYSR